MEPAPSWSSYAKDVSESVARRIELRLLVVLLLPVAKTYRVRMVLFSAVAHAVLHAELVCSHVHRQIEIDWLMIVKDMSMHSGTWHSRTVFSSRFPAAFPAELAKIEACAGKSAKLGQEQDTA